MVMMMVGVVMMMMGVRIRGNRDWWPTSHVRRWGTIWNRSSVRMSSRSWNWSRNSWRWNCSRVNWHRGRLWFGSAERRHGRRWCRDVRMHSWCCIGWSLIVIFWVSKEC